MECGLESDETREADSMNGPCAFLPIISNIPPGLISNSLSYLACKISSSIVRTEHSSYIYIDKVFAERSVLASGFKDARLQYCMHCITAPKHHAYAPPLCLSELRLLQQPRQPRVHDGAATGPSMATLMLHPGTVSREHFLFLVSSPLYAPRPPALPSAH